MASQYTCALLLTDDLELAEPAERLVRSLFQLRHVSMHSRTEKRFPDQASELIEKGEVDVLLNYLAPMIVPGSVLSRVRREAINFHPAPPAWPGIGSASYALYRGDKTFGATAHRMTSRIDAGDIVRVVRFPVLPDDSCDSLFKRGLASTLPLLTEVCEELARTGTLTPSGEVWDRPAITRNEFERWMTLSPADPPDEVNRKVRALRHPRFPGPFFEIDGVRVPVDMDAVRSDA